MIAAYQDNPANRAELVAFLEVAFQAAKGAVGGWAERMAHWWDENPFAHMDSRRGWIMRDAMDGRLVGFLGLIPTCYAIDGEPHPALLPTTWVVEPSFQKESFGLARRLNRIGSEVLVISTTGRAAFQGAMRRRGWIHHEQGSRRFLPFGRIGDALLPEQSPLRKGRSIVSSIDEAAGLAKPFRKGLGIEKWITMDYLRWYLRSPVGKHHFVGLVDEQDRLTSYLVLVPKRVFGVAATWSVFDWFTTEQGNHEMVFLLSAILKNPADFGLGKPWLLRLTEMSDDPVWCEIRGIWPSAVELNHLYKAPTHLRDLPKSWVLAEGDLGL